MHQISLPIIRHRPVNFVKNRRAQVNNTDVQTYGHVKHSPPWLHNLVQIFGKHQRGTTACSLIVINLARPGNKVSSALPIPLIRSVSSTTYP